SHTDPRASRSGNRRPGNWQRIRFRRLPCHGQRTYTSGLTHDPTEHNLRIVASSGGQAGEPGGVEDVDGGVADGDESVAFEVFEDLVESGALHAEHGEDRPVGDTFHRSQERRYLLDLARFKIKPSITVGVGKTHIAVALAVAACRAGYS